MKSKLCFFGFCFLLSCQIHAQLYGDLEENKEQVKDDVFFSILTGFSFMPTTYESTSVNIIHANFPDIDTTLPEVSFSNGFYFGFAGHFPGDWYTNFNLSMVFSSSQESRRTDNAGFGSIGIGKEFNLIYDSKDYVLSLETGVGFRTLERPFTKEDNVRSGLNRSDFVLTPALVFDVNLHNERIFLYFSGRYIYSFSNFRTGIWRQDKRTSNNSTSTSRFHNEDAKIDNGAYLDIGNMFEFAIGLRFKFKDKNRNLID